MILACTLASWGLAAEAEVRRVFPLAPGGTVILDSYRGAVTITDSDRDEVQLVVRITVDADTDEEAARFRDDFELDAKAEQNIVAIVARNRRASGARFVWNEKGDLGLSYELMVPRRSEVTVRVRQGSVVVGDLAGRVSAHLEQGSISFRQIDGSIDASTRLGDITISRCLGSVSATVDRGQIRVGTVTGDLRLKNNRGDIEVMTAKGAVVAEAAVGDIAVNFARELKADSRLATSAGNIIAMLNAGSACNVQASSVWGHVRSELPIQAASGAEGSRKLSGSLNGGGPLLAFRANGGSVKLMGGEAPFDQQ